MWGFVFLAVTVATFDLGEFGLSSCRYFTGASQKSVWIKRRSNSATSLSMEKVTLSWFCLAKQATTCHDRLDPAMVKVV